MSERQSVVHIWIGSEWAPIRAAFSGYVAAQFPAPSATVAILAESLVPEHPTGRIAGWLSKALASRGVTVTERQIGDAFDLEPASAQTVIGITDLLLDPDPRQVDQLYAIGLWSRFVPRRKRWMMRVTPFLTEEIVDNAARANPALLVQIAEWRGQRVLIASPDLIASEVIGRGLRSVAQPAGDIGETPWQTDLIRIASERRLGVPSGPQIAVEIHRAGPMPQPMATEFHALMQVVGRLVECGVTFAG